MLTEYRRDGLRFDVRDEGPRDGEPTVLLHGFPQDSASWDRVAPLLHAGGLRTLAPDQRGYSPGARPGARAAYRLPELAADVLALLDRAGIDSAHVVGHDWGGAVAWALGSHLPQRVRSLTVLSTPHPAALRRALLTSTQALHSSYMGLFQLPRLPERLLAPRLASVLERSGLSPGDAARYAARMNQPGALTGALNWYRAIPWSPGNVGAVTVPTTYVWGERDFALRRTAAEATGRFVEADYELTVLRAGHWLPERRPVEVADAVLARAGRTPKATDR